MRNVGHHAAGGAAAHPLYVSLPGGRVRHSAKLVNGGPVVITLCRKRGTPTGPGDNLGYCKACSARPNPIDNRAYVS